MIVFLRDDGGREWSQRVEVEFLCVRACVLEGFVGFRV
jgi:hypothetical protein